MEFSSHTFKLLMWLTGFMASGYFIQYIQAFLGLSFIGPLWAIIHRISLGHTANKIGAFLDMKGATFLSMGKIHELNADIMAVSGYLAYACIPIAMGLATSGIKGVVSSIAGGMSSAQSNANLTAGESVTGNIAVGNGSYANFQKWNINEYNTARDNDNSDNINKRNRTIGNDTLNNKNEGNRIINTHAENTLTKDVITENMETRNKKDTSMLERHGFLVKENAQGMVKYDSSSNPTESKINRIDSFTKEHYTHNQENTKQKEVNKGYNLNGSLSLFGISGSGSYGENWGNSKREASGTVTTSEAEEQARAKAEAIQIQKSQPNDINAILEIGKKPIPSTKVDPPYGASDLVVDTTKEIIHLSPAQVRESLKPAFMRDNSVLQKKPDKNNSPINNKQ